MPDLPKAWRTAIRYCPYCPGALGRNEDGSVCQWCRGSGDLMATLLIAAYRQGREDALMKLAEVRSVAALAFDLLEQSPVDGKRLKREAGL